MAKKATQAPAGRRKAEPVGGGERVGYLRATASDETAGEQREALRAAGCARIVEDRGDDAVTQPKLDRALRAMKAGDTLVVARLDRLGRSLVQLIRLIADLGDKQVGFVSLDEKIELGRGAAAAAARIFRSLAEIDRTLVRERTRAGIASARAEGRVGGRKPKLGPKDVKQIRAMLRRGGVTVTDAAARYGVSRVTLYSHLRKTPE